MEFKQFLRPLGMSLAPLAVGVGGGGTGMWLWLASEKRDIEVRLTEANTSLDEIKVRTVDLEQQRKDAEKELEEAIKSKGSNRQEIENLSNRITDLNDEKEKLNREEVQLNGQIEGLTVEQKRLFTEIESKQHKLKEIISDLQKKRSLLKENEVQISDLEKQKQKLQEEKQQLEKQKNTSAKNSTDLNDQIKNLETKMNKLEEENARLLKEKENYRREVTEKEKEMEEQVKTIKKQNTDLSDSLIDLVKKVQENARKKEENEKIRLKVVQKTRELEAKNLEIEQKTRDLLEQQKKLGAQIATNNEQMQRIILMGEEKQKRSKDISSLEKRISNLKGQLEKEEQDLSSKEQELKNKRRQIDSDNAEIVVKDRTIKEHDAIIKDLKERISRIRRQIFDSYGGVLAETSKGKNYDFLNIGIRKVSFVNEEQKDNQEIFKLVDGEGKEVQFKKPDSFFLEESLKSVETLGNLNWNGKFRLNVGKQSWTSESSFIRDDKEGEEIDFLTIFDSKYKQEAMKTLVSIKILQEVSFQLKDGVFELQSSTDYSDLIKLLANENTDSWTININVQSFKTKEDFIKYWIIKTFERVEKGLANFDEIFNPVLRESSYRSKN